jgi:uncharacterized membrane protein YgcG
MMDVKTNARGALMKIRTMLHTTHRATWLMLATFSLAACGSGGGSGGSGDSGGSGASAA